MEPVQQDPCAACEHQDCPGLPSMCSPRAPEDSAFFQAAPDWVRMMEKNILQTIQDLQPDLGPDRLCSRCGSGWAETLQILWDIPSVSPETHTGDPELLLFQEVNKTTLHDLHEVEKRIKNKGIKSRLKRKQRMVKQQQQQFWWFWISFKAALLLLMRSWTLHTILNPSWWCWTNSVALRPWYSQIHPGVHRGTLESMTWTFGRGRREERERLSWQRETKSTWSLEAGNDFWNHPKESQGQLTATSHPTRC